MPSAPFLCIAQDLESIEEILAERAGSEVPLARDVCSYVHAAGGKRLRPALVVLMARALGCRTEEPLYTAAAAEMIHAATLLHDDVVDLAESRRGTPTANARWGDGAAVMAGNILLAKSFQLLVERRHLGILQVMSDTMLTMCRGELMQNMYCGDLEMGEGTYSEIIRCKTADFLAACCRSGALLALAPEYGAPALTQEVSARCDRAAAYGMALGMAFQITDDLLDLMGEEQVTGKPRGGDLREGKMTLPLILALQEATAEERRRIRQVVKGESIQAAELQEVVEVVLRTGAHHRAREAARARVAEAKRQLALLPPSPARDALHALADSLSDRTR